MGIGTEDEADLEILKWAEELCHQAGKSWDNWREYYLQAKILYQNYRRKEDED